MTYLTYEEYSNMGGVLDITAFNRSISKVCGIINNATHRRIECMKTIPQSVKALCRDLVEHISANSTSEKLVTSRSQSAGGVSESESYEIKSREEIQVDIDNIIADYLTAETDDNGTPLLYRGCIR